MTRFRPLAGCGLFLKRSKRNKREVKGFRPLAGCGLFRQSCTFFLVQQEKELSTLLFYCMIETYHGLTTSKPLQLRCFQSS